MYTNDSILCIVYNILIAQYTCTIQSPRVVGGGGLSEIRRKFNGKTGVRGFRFLTKKPINLSRSGGASEVKKTAHIFSVKTHVQGFSDILLARFTPPSP